MLGAMCAIAQLQRLVGRGLPALDLLDLDAERLVGELDQGPRDPDVLAGHQHREVAAAHLGRQVELRPPQGQLGVKHVDRRRRLGQLELAARLDHLVEEEPLVAGGAPGAGRVRLVAETRVV